MRRLLTLLGCLLLASPLGFAQNPQPFNPAFAPGNQGLGGPQQRVDQSAAGGGVNADFEGLMDLIVSTVAPESWAENGGGEAEIRPFVGGVWADASGTLRRLKTDARPTSARVALARDLGRLHNATATAGAAAMAEANPRRHAALRCVSLTRLEREVQRRIDKKLPLDESMLAMAGLRRVRYVFVYPDSGEIALAGAAGDWRVSDERRLVAADTGEPVVRLDDLLTLLRRDPRSAFGCSIDPRPDSLASAQLFLGEHPIPKSQRARDRWLEEVCDAVGLQDLTYVGVPADSRVACVLGEADYHMKLLGMGLADGAAGMESYLDSIRVEPGESPPPLGAVRWWFGMHYAAIESSQSGDAYGIVGQGVKLMSENEALAERGQRIPTGQSDEYALAYAAAFTQHFDALCEKHALYAELRNVFDLSLVAALLDEHRLLSKANWRPELLCSAERLPLPQYQAATSVETIANLREVNRRQVLANVSGGVWAQPVEVLRTRRRTADEYGPVTNHRSAVPAAVAGWWWDLEE